MSKPLGQKAQKPPPGGQQFSFIAKKHSYNQTQISQFFWATKTWHHLFILITHSCGTAFHRETDSAKQYGKLFFFFFKPPSSNLSYAICPIFNLHHN